MLVEGLGQSPLTFGVGDTSYRTGPWKIIRVSILVPNWEGEQGDL